jgi:hypothetical protein
MPRSFLGIKLYKKYQKFGAICYLIIEGILYIGGRGSKYLQEVHPKGGAGLQPPKTTKTEI